MNNKIIILVLVVIILIVFISGFFLIKDAFKTEEPKVPGVVKPYLEEPTNTDEETQEEIITEEPIDSDNIVYFSEDNCGLNTNNVSKYITGSHEVLPDKLIDGVTYKDINSVTVTSSPALSLDKAEILNDGNNYAVIANTYDIVNGNLDSSIYANDVELLPSRLYLSDDSINAFYTYGGIVYYIPVEKALNEAEERIEYKDSKLIIMKNTGEISAFGKDIHTNYNYDEANNLVEGVADLFNLYYSKTPSKNLKCEKAFISTSFNDGLETIILNAFEKREDEAKENYICKVFLTSQDGVISKAVAPLDIGQNMIYSNVFYSHNLNASYGISGISTSYIPTSYYIYIDNHFEKVYRFINGDRLSKPSDEFLNTTYKTLKDLYYTNYEVDGHYNKLFDNSASGDSFIKYKIISKSLAEDLSNVLPSNSEFVINKVIDKNGNAVIKDKTGNTYILKAN